jgi:copper(I)-binding protein
MAEMDMPMGDEGEMIHDMGDDMAVGEMATPEWDEACVGLHVIDAWARPTVPGAPTSAAYALIVNLTNTDADETLLSVSTDAAEASEIHEMTMTEGDVMRMNPVEGGLTIPAGGAVLLQPGGLHIMLMNLTDALEVGDVLDFTLTFANADEIEVSIPVHDPDAEDMGDE